MPKQIFWPNFRKIFDKKHPSQPRQASIYRWLTLGMILVVAVTVFLGGLPAMGIIWWQLENQVRLCVSNAQSSTQALYAAEQRNFLQLTQLISKRPTLCALLQGDDIRKLTSYMVVIRQNSPIDTLIVISADEQLFISGSGIDLSQNTMILERHEESFAGLIALENPARLAIFAVSEIASAEGCEKGSAGRVIAIRILDHEFMETLSINTGLEQSVIIGDRRVATSFVNATDWPHYPDLAWQTLRTEESCCKLLKSDDEMYYVGLAPLLDHQGNLIALSEVAFSATDIHNGAWNTMGLLFGTGILVILAGAGLTLFLTRRITRPLYGLAESAERMGAGDLDTPVPLTSGWIAIDRLANQLDHSRRNLRQNQRVARREFRRIVHLLGATREGVVTISMDGIVTWANMDACNILGYDVLDLLRKPYLDVFRPAPQENATLRHVLQPIMGQPVPSHLVILNAQGSPVTLSVTHSVLTADEEDAVNFTREHVVILRDVSEEQAVHRLRSEFLGNMAHEFRTPLSAISASTELMVEEGGGMTSDELSSLAHTIRVSTVHLQSLVDDLLESAMIEAGVFQLRCRSIQLQDVLDNVNKMMAPLLQRRQQRLEVEAPENLTGLVGDPDRLKQAMVNLVENASKFSPNSAVINLSVKQEAELLVFTVLDSGPGLPTERFSEVFNRFFTGGHPRGSQYGIGLGLPIVKVIAEAHGGHVGAQNRPEGGAKVWFTISYTQQGRKGECA